MKTPALLGASMLVSMLAAALLGCEDGELRAADYDQSCSIEAEDSWECVGVVVGDTCECDAPCAAINRDDLDRYGADLNDLPGCGFSVAPSCAEQPTTRCESSPVACRAGQCVLR